jgi:cytochrome c oxidase subunit 2
MEPQERRWLALLIFVAIAFNALTLSPLVPWQRWMIWSQPIPAQQVSIQMSDYTITRPVEPVTIPAGEYVEIIALSNDVTYGFGVFRPDGTMVFQMQVLPEHQNRLLWKFETPGSYDVRSTEYSGPEHSGMYFPGFIRITAPQGG